ncbi:MAG: cell wall hydrolase [Lachnospiraceae bacterium]|nr:cell wall hydrolase [Lachnospiraceae bacterium]MBO5144358.1 cell wall hydrolase [Lachnospiraceae bacterium]
MKTNCKKWKYMLFITAIATAFASVPLNTQAADTKMNITDGTGKKQETTSDKMNSADKTMTLATTAGAADLLDADISMKDEELTALVKSKTLSVSEQKTEEQKSTLVMANVNEYANIRQEADQDSEKVGVIYKDCGGDIIETNGEWTKIKSGDVIGWIKNEYLYFGDEAKELAEEVGSLTAYSDTETLRVRKEADMESGVLGLLANGETVEAIAQEGDWVSVSYEGTTGYVSADYVKVEFDIDTAESMAVIKAREEAEKAKAAAKAEAARNSQKEAVIATASEVDILAALIQCEAGGEPYEGQVAVGAVVMNRVRSGGYPNSITEVIYASGQFVPASKGRMESLILNGNIKASCVQAAQEAIAGRCNVGDALHFKRAGNKDGLIIGNHVFW